MTSYPVKVDEYGLTVYDLPDEVRQERLAEVRDLRVMVPGSTAFERFLKVLSRDATAKYTRAEREAKYQECHRHKGGNNWRLKTDAPHRESMPDWLRMRCHSGRKYATEDERQYAKRVGNRLAHLRMRWRKGYPVPPTLDAAIYGVPGPPSPAWQPCFSGVRPGDELYRPDQEGVATP